MAEQQAQALLKSAEEIKYDHLRFKVRFLLGRKGKGRVGEGACLNVNLARPPPIHVPPGSATSGCGDRIANR